MQTQKSPTVSKSAITILRSAPNGFISYLIPRRFFGVGFVKSFLRFLTPENRNSLMSSSNQKGTLKRMLNFNTKKVFNEDVKKIRKTKKLKRQSNR